MNKRKIKRITYLERMQIEILLKEGLEISEIASILGRSRSSLSTEIVRAGGREVYSASISQHQRDIFKKIRIENLKKERPRKLIKTNDSIEQRFKNLEMQIEILHDTIKDLLNLKKEL